MTDRSVNYKCVPKSEEQFEQIRQERRSEILEAALAVFSQKGFSNASITDIAKQAKISKGLMYNYFQSKQELLVAVVHMAFEKIPTLFNEKNYGDPKVYLKRVIQEMITSIRVDLPFWKMYFLLGTHILIDPSIMEYIQPQVTQIEGTVYDFFAYAGIANPELEADKFNVTLDGLFMAYMQRPNLDIEAIATSICDDVCAKMNPR